MDRGTLGALAAISTICAAILFVCAERQRDYIQELEREATGRIPTEATADRSHLFDADCHDLSCGQFRDRCENVCEGLGSTYAAGFHVEGRFACSGPEGVDLLSNGFSEHERIMTMDWPCIDPE